MSHHPRMSPRTGRACARVAPFYVLHSGGNGVPGNVLRVNAASGPSYGARTLFATYIAPSTPSNYSLLMRS